MRTVLVRPIAARVLDPITREPLAAHGRRVALTTYWRRRIADGSVELVERPPKTTRRARAEKPDTSEE